MDQPKTHKYEAREILPGLRVYRCMQPGCGRVVVCSFDADGELVGRLNHKIGDPTAAHAGMYNGLPGMVDAEIGARLAPGERLQNPWADWYDENRDLFGEGDDG
jgi:hypothetical protein